MSSNFSDVTCYALANGFFMTDRGDPNEQALKLECLLRIASLDAALASDKWKNITPKYLARWMVNNGGDPFSGRYDTSEALKTMAWGHLTTADLIKKVTGMSSYDLTWIGAQQAVKERLRYLARQVFLKQEASKSEKNPQLISLKS